MLAIIYIIGGAFVSVVIWRYLFFLVVNIIKKLFCKDDIKNIFVRSLKQTFFMNVK